MGLAEKIHVALARPSWVERGEAFVTLGPAILAWMTEARELIEELDDALCDADTDNADRLVKWQALGRRVTEFQKNNGGSPVKVTTGTPQNGEN